MTEVSLATFHLFDRENLGSGGQEVAVVICRRCRDCRVAEIGAAATAGSGDGAAGAKFRESKGERPCHLLASR